jgi:hypothetical protein
MVLEANDGTTEIAGELRDQSKPYAWRLRGWLAGLRAIRRAIHFYDRVVDLDERRAVDPGRRV